MIVLTYWEERTPYLYLILGRCWTFVRGNGRWRFVYVKKKMIKGAWDLFVKMLDRSVDQILTNLFNKCKPFEPLIFIDMIIHTNMYIGRTYLHSWWKQTLNLLNLHGWELYEMLDAHITYINLPKPLTLWLICFKKYKC